MNVIMQIEQICLQLISYISNRSLFFVKCNYYKQVCNVKQRFKFNYFATFKSNETSEIKLAYWLISGAFHWNCANFYCASLQNHLSYIAKNAYVKH